MASPASSLSPPDGVGSAVEGSATHTRLREADGGNGYLGRRYSVVLRADAFLAAFFAGAFLAAVFLAAALVPAALVALEARFFLGAGPSARLSASNSAARSRV